MERLEPVLFNNSSHVCAHVYEHIHTHAPESNSKKIPVPPVPLKILIEENQKRWNQQEEKMNIEPEPIVEPAREFAETFDSEKLIQKGKPPVSKLEKEPVKS